MNFSIKLQTISILLVMFCFGLSTEAQVDRVDSGKARKMPNEENTSEEDQLSPAQQLEAEQQKLAERYKLLEEKLFSLHEYEKGSNPLRSKLLERAFLQSQERMTSSQMKSIVDLLAKTRLKDAQAEQGEVLSQLNALLELLQSEDRGKRVRDEIQRHQEYLKEVERLLRIQKGIRGQAEGGVDQKRLANTESNTAKRAKQLADNIRENEEGDDPSQGSGNNPDTDANADAHSPDGSEPSQPNNGKPGKQDRATEGSESQDPSNAPQQDENPTRRRIEAAEQKMRDATEKLENALRDDAIADMKQAEREIALAKKELEEILRQLREEEVERTLAMLETRFRQMLEREVRLHESTRKLNAIVVEQRGTDFEIRSGKLSLEQGSIATEAARALLLLREDGSSVAFPATVDEMHQDMLQVATRLSAAKTGQITIEIEEDIIDTLDYLVKALVQTQEDMERMKQQSQSQQSGQPGDEPLVDQLAEIKMLRGLQERILRRHRRYAKFLSDPDSEIGDTEDPDLQAALQRLAEKQAQLTDIARDIVNEKNK